MLSVFTRLVWQRRYQSGSEDNQKSGALSRGGSYRSGRAETDEHSGHSKSVVSCLLDVIRNRIVCYRGQKQQQKNQNFF